MYCNGGRRILTMRNGGSKLRILEDRVPVRTVKLEDGQGKLRPVRRSKRLALRRTNGETSPPREGTREGIREDENCDSDLPTELPLSEAYEIRSRDVFMMAPYDRDILKYMQEQECRCLATGLSCVSTSHRKILVDWLIAVQCHQYLTADTLHLAVALTDACLSARSISLLNLQLLGITCLFIASKYEEVYTVPDLQTLCGLCADTYTPDQIRVMERCVLRTLDFNLFYPTSTWFLAHFLAISGRSEDVELVRMCEYLLDLALLHPDFIRTTPPSLQAAAALRLAFTVVDGAKDRKSEVVVWPTKLSVIVGGEEVLKGTVVRLKQKALEMDWATQQVVKPGLASKYAHELRVVLAS